MSRTVYVSGTINIQLTYFQWSSDLRIDELDPPLLRTTLILTLSRGSTRLEFPSSSEVCYHWWKTPEKIVDSDVLDVTG